MTHLALVTIGFLRGSRARLRLGRIYAITAGTLHLCTVAVGLLVYPAYRYWVAGLYLNRHAAWASNLFDVKEAAGLFGVPLALGLLWLGRRFDTVEKPAVPAFAMCAFGLWAFDAICIVSGLLITSERGV